MPEEIKQKIYDFLKENQGKKFAVKRIFEQTKFASLPTIHKWVGILIAEERISVDDYGNIKLVYVDENRE